MPVRTIDITEVNRCMSVQVNNTRISEVRHCCVDKWSNGSDEGLPLRTNDITEMRCCLYGQMIQRNRCCTCRQKYNESVFALPLREMIK